MKGFSTQLVDLTLEDIKRGIFRTTGGTDLNLPLIDAIKSKKKKILIITDLIGKLSENVINQAKQSNIKVYTIIFQTKFTSPITKQEFEQWKRMMEKIWILKI